MKRERILIFLQRLLLLSVQSFLLLVQWSFNQRWSKLRRL